MTSEDSCEPVESETPGTSRKRPVCTEEWRDTLRKKETIGCDGSAPSIRCDHGSGHWCRVRDLLESDVIKHHHAFHSLETKALQDAYITNYFETRPISRHKGGAMAYERTHSIQYFLKSHDGSKRRVCLESFCGVFRINKRSVQRLAQYFEKDGCSRPELRGVRRELSALDTLRVSIKNHIQSFRCVPSLYPRQGRPRRKYLPATLSIMAMWRMFRKAHKKDTHFTECTYEQYRLVFNTCFNLGFGTPRTDICSECEDKIQGLKNTVDGIARVQLALELLLHEHEARKFYALLNEEFNETTAVFAVEMMQTQPLPRVPIGEAFQARHLWLYILGFVRHFGRHCRQTRGDCIVYAWTENQAGRGCDEIASAVVDFFRRFAAVNPHIRTVRIFSDSCAAQIKCHELLLVLSALSHEINVIFELNYPMAGHSILPADRMFGRLEKILRRYDTLLTPAEYVPLLAKVSYTRVLSLDWSVCCFQRAASLHLRTQQNSRISTVKFIRVLAGGVIESADAYGYATREYCLCASRENFSHFRLDRVPLSPLGRPIKKEKLNDIMKLLRKAGITDAHPSWHFYSALVTGRSSDASSSD